MIRAFYSSLLYLHGGDFEKRGVEKRLSRCVLCRSMLVMIVLCIDGAICLRVLRDKGHGGGQSWNAYWGHVCACCVGRTPTSQG